MRKISRPRLTAGYDQGYQSRRNWHKCSGFAEFLAEDGRASLGHLGANGVRFAYQRDARIKSGHDDRGKAIAPYRITLPGA
jgi:hypothetical protein